MLVLRGLIGGLFQIGIIAACLLIPAGTWHWPRALQFLGAYGVVLAIAIVSLARLAPASLEVRLSAPAAESQPTADRIISPLLFASLFGWLAFVPIDVFRLQLLPAPSLGVSIAGALVSFAGYVLIWKTLYQNAFAAPIVKDQSEQGQTLIDTGPYAYVRHPMYAGFAPFFLGLGLWLESWASVPAFAIPLVLFVARIRTEEATLVDSLPGYREYRERVRYRLVPGIW